MTNEERIELIRRRYFDENATYTEIGKELTLTTERIRQLIKRHFPGQPRGHERQRRAREAKEQADLANKPKCIVCGKTIPPRSGRWKTCSEACGKRYNWTLYQQDPRRRQSCQDSSARYVLRNREKYNPAHVRWAIKRLTRKKIDDQ